MNNINICELHLYCLLVLFFGKKTYCLKLIWQLTFEFITTIYILYILLFLFYNVGLFLFWFIFFQSLLFIIDGTSPLIGGALIAQQRICFQFQQKGFSLHSSSILKFYSNKSQPFTNNYTFHCWNGKAITMLNYNIHNYS